MKAIYPRKFRVMIVKMIKEFGRRTDAQSEKLADFKKELENIKNNKKELKNTITEMKNTLEGINSKLNEAEEGISELEDRLVEITAAKKKKERKRKRIKRNEDSVRDLRDNKSHTNIYTIGVPEGAEREKGAENIFEDIIAENFPNLGKETDIQVQEAQRVPNRIDPKRTRPRHTVLKMSKIKDKERLLKASGRGLPWWHSG